MRSQLFLIPAALVVSVSAPTVAAYYLTLDEAQGLMFPGVTLEPRFVTLTEGQAKALAAQAPVHGYQVKAWQASNGGWFILDQVEGKGDLITYAVALNREGVVQSIEILECVPDYNTVRMPEWRAQFVGQVAGEKRRIANISGSTLSAQHIAEGVRRVLATHALVLKPRSV